MCLISRFTLDASWIIMNLDNKLDRLENITIRFENLLYKDKEFCVQTMYTWGNRYQYLRFSGIYNTLDDAIKKVQYYRAVEKYKYNSYRICIRNKGGTEYDWELLQWMN